MLVISRRRSEPDAMGSAKSIVMESPAGVAVESMLRRLRPSRTVTRVVDSSKEASSGRVSVTEVTSSPSSTVPSQVRRVATPPTTPLPPCWLGRAVALFVVRASAVVGMATTATSTARASGTSAASNLLGMVRVAGAGALSMVPPKSCGEGSQGLERTPGFQHAHYASKLIRFK